TLSKLTTGEKLTLKWTCHRRETLLLLIKVLRFESLEKCNQFLQSANHEVLTEEERKRYCCHLELPKPFLTESTKKFIEELLAHFKLSYAAPILLLTQTDRAPIIEAVFSQLTTRYPANSCCHLTLPCTAESYFSQVAQRCGFLETVQNSSQFEMLLNKKLSAIAHPYFLLISRFEYAPKELGQELAGILRGLSANHLHLMLCGGQKLEELKYLTGELSLLNFTEIHYWPELNREDIFAMRDERCQGLLLSEEVADQLLVFCGGHPTLLKIALQWYQELPSLETLTTYPQRLSEIPEISGWFMPYLQNSQKAQKIVEWLTALKIAPAREFLPDPLLRDLYWKNLLVRRNDNWVYWRCEAIRLAGKAVFR
ncbi:MAG: hypothetical protein BWK78_01050, partial [Thiotrichaceae bacterium IS1]